MPSQGCGTHSLVLPDVPKRASSVSCIVIPYGAGSPSTINGWDRVLQVLGVSDPLLPLRVFLVFRCPPATSISRWVKTFTNDPRGRFRVGRIELSDPLERVRRTVGPHPIVNAVELRLRHSEYSVPVTPRAVFSGSFASYLRHRGDRFSSPRGFLSWPRLLWRSDQREHPELHRDPDGERHDRDDHATDPKVRSRRGGSCFGRRSVMNVITTALASRRGTT